MISIGEKNETYWEKRNLSMLAYLAQFGSNVLHAGSCDDSFYQQGNKRRKIIILKEENV